MSFKAHADGLELDGKRFGGRMEFVISNPTAVKKTSFGLLELEKKEVVDTSRIDLIHVPGLAFTTESHRIRIWWRILTLSGHFCWA